MTQYFLVASGGTGMRCLQSFIQSCSLGLFPNRTIHILLLETDEENKDKRNTENLVKWYSNISAACRDTANNSEKKKKSAVDRDKRNLEEGITTKGGSTESLIGDYFSSNIKLYTFVPDYSKDDTRNFKVISQVERGNSKINQELANIFYEKAVQSFHLDHGYRAQTHLGSYLMYHAMMDEIRKAMEDDSYKVKSQFLQFIQEVQKAASQGSARVFAMGSTFGGTGASTIPVLSRSITDACKILTDDKIKMDSIHYGGTVLCPYFKFPPPSDNHKKKDKVVAQSEFFAHNSASALMYYVNDKTILSTYKRLYILGWGGSGLDWCDVDDYKSKYLGVDKNNPTATGGKKQENPGHVMELFSAMAAKHFFEETTTRESELKNISSTEFLFKSLMIDGSSDSKVPVLDWDDIFSTKAGNQVAFEIRNNTLGLLTLSALLNYYFNNTITELFRNLRHYNINYSVDNDTLESLKYFFAYFFTMDNPYSEENPIPGWIKQLYLTFHGNRNPAGNKFLGLNPDLMKPGSSGVNWYKSFKNFDGEAVSMDKFVAAMLRHKSPGKDAGGIGMFFHHLRQVMNNLPNTAIPPR